MAFNVNASWPGSITPARPNDGAAERIDIAFNPLFANFAESVAAPMWKPSAGNS